MRMYYSIFVLALLAAVPALAVPADAEPLRGVVMTAEGKPAAGAIVWAARHTHGPLERRETVADANGRYALRLYPGEWYVWARRGTQGAEVPGAHQAVEIPAGRAPDELNITLEERGLLRGRLLEGETGKPIAGGKFFLDAGLFLTTNAEGRFEIGGLVRTNHEAFVVAPGRLRMRVLFDTTARADTELDVPVPRGGKIVGRITDLDGKPIAGAFVGRGTSGTFFSINALYEPCAADGRFEYDGLALDRSTDLEAQAPGFVEEGFNTTVIAPGDKPVEMNFRLRPLPPEKPGGKDDKRRVVKGVVLGPNSVPQPGIRLRWGQMPYTEAPRTITDDAGRFSLTVPDEANTLVVIPRLYMLNYEQVATGGDKEVVVRLKAGNTLRGRVIDEAGQPIKDVHVVLSNNTWDKYTQSGTDGKFELPGVPESATYAVLKRGFTDERNAELSVANADNTVVLQHGGALKGRVVDRDGKPLRDFRVLLDFPKNRQAGERTDGFFAGYSGIGVRFTSPDGSFVLTGVGAGSVYRVRAIAEGHGEAVEDRVLAVPSNRLANTEAVTLKAGPPVSFRVRTVDPAGKPIAGARVTLIDGQPRLDQEFGWGYDDVGWDNQGRGRTNGDGWADFPALSFGGATVVVRAPGYARQHVGWRRNEKEITLKLAAEAVVIGVVRDAAGEPMKAGYVVLTGGNGDRVVARFRADDKGRFRAAELPAGKWKVQVYGENGQTVVYEGEVTTKAGESNNMAINAKN
jgi:protocatechuate 3,4-dioxygenase beta subunit